MKKLSFLTVALFLFFGISCQKEELEIPQEEFQNVVYSFNLGEDEEAIVAARASNRPCSCSLNVSANRNNTEIGPFNDWRAWVQFSDGTYAARFGGAHEPYMGSVSSASFADEMGVTESLPFLPPTNLFDLVIAFPSNTDWDPGIVSASVTCLYANYSGGVGFTYTGLDFSPTSAPMTGAISSCSVYPFSNE